MSNPHRGDRHHKTDANHAEVREAFRDAGCLVVDTSHVGGGFPDLIVEVAGRLIFVEVKDGKKAPSDRRLTPVEMAFSMLWRRHWYLVEPKEAAIDLITPPRLPQHERRMKDLSGTWHCACGARLMNGICVATLETVGR